MANEKKTESSSISITGGVKGKGIAIGHGAKASNTEGGTASPNQELTDMLKDIIARLDSLPEEHQQDAEAVKAMAESLDQSVQNDASKSILNIQAQGLKQAAETLKEVAPTVLSIAAQVLVFVSKLA